MILFSEFNPYRNDTYKIYVEAYPLKIYDMDFSFILDNALEIMKEWASSIKWVPDNKSSNILEYFKNDGRIWITDIEGFEYELTQENVVRAIGKLKEVHRDIMVTYNNELIAPCYNELLSDTIIQIAIGRIEKL